MMVVASAVGACAQVPGVSLENLLVRYQRAMNDPGEEKRSQTAIEGVIVGGGLRGSFRTLRSGENERVEQNLGLRRERQIRLGNRYFFVDESGDVREYHGLLLRHARTEDLMDAGELNASSGCCRLLGGVNIKDRSTYELAVTADGGDTELLYLDAQTALPVRVAYDEDDGQTTLDFSDWRTVSGRRFAFRTVASDGNHAYDITQITSSIRTDVVIAEDAFTVPQQRFFEAVGVQHVALIQREGHFFVPVRIGAGAYTFLLDSGAQGILLDKRTAHALRLHEEGTLEASGAQRTGGLRSALAPALHIGGATMRNIVVSTLDFGVSTQGAFHIDGILGYPFFASGMVRMDFPHAKMDFGPPDSLIAQGDYLDADLDRGLPEATMIADNVSGRFIIDTGNAEELLLYGPFVREHPGIVPTTLSNMRSYGLGGSTDSYRSLLRQIIIGTTKLSDVHVGVMSATQGAFADRFDAGNVGLGILRNFTLTFDYPDDAVYMEK